MYVIIANGFQGIIRTKDELDLVSSLFPYPKFRKVRSYEEAEEFFNKYKRGLYKPNFHHYGETDFYNGFAKIQYFLESSAIYCNINTEKLGNVYFKSNERHGIFFDNRKDYSKLVIKQLNLDNDSISSHCLAVASILTAIGNVIDVDVTIPDISVYLAITRFSGNLIRNSGVQTIIKERLGGVSFTIE